jgi:hypothetical protein
VKQFKSVNGSQGLGNQGNATAVLVTLIYDALDKHPNISEDLRLA